MRWGFVGFECQVAGCGLGVIHADDGAARCA